MGTLTMILDNFSLVFRESQTPRKSLEKVKADPWGSTLGHISTCGNLDTTRGAHYSNLGKLW